MGSKDCTVVKDVEPGFILEHGLPPGLPVEGIAAMGSVNSNNTYRKERKPGRSMKCESPYHHGENSSAIFLIITA